MYYLIGIASGVAERAADATRHEHARPEQPLLRQQQSLSKHVTTRLHRTKQLTIRLEIPKNKIVIHKIYITIYIYLHWILAYLTIIWYNNLNERRQTNNYNRIYYKKYIYMYIVLTACMFSGVRQIRLSEYEKHRWAITTFKNN